MRRPSFVPVLAVLATAGCGHAVDPRAPFDDPARLPVPRALSARVDVAQGIVVSWSATAADRAIVDGWRLERRATTSSVFEAVGGAALRRDTTFVDGDVADGVRVVYRVRGVTAAGVESAPAETAPVRADLVAPGAPAGVSAATASGGIALTFTPGPEADIALFEARLSATSGTEPPLFRQVAASPALLSGLVAGREYAIEVAAIDSAGRLSPPSAPPAVATAGP